jgi:protocatechuate 3,4-dioxygenase, beta subunit
LTDPTQAIPDLAQYRRAPEGTHPPLLSPGYASTVLRAPKDPLIHVPQTLTEITGPLLGEGRLGELDHDPTRQHGDEPLGERIIVHGRVLDGDGRPIRNTLVEVWQANAAGRYQHEGDQHPAPLDPNFIGMGRCLTDDDGGYEFTTIKPGPYPWRNHHNAWRPAHIHFSLFGTDFTQRLVTQMYFPGDPLFALDPIYQSIVDPQARERLVATYDHDLTDAEWCTGYRWDIVLTGSAATPLEEEE